MKTPPHTLTLCFWLLSSLVVVVGGEDIDECVCGFFVYPYASISFSFVVCVVICVDSFLSFSF